MELGSLITPVRGVTTTAGPGMMMKNEVVSMICVILVMIALDDGD